MQKQLQGFAPLTHLGIIRAQGEDAAKFLHGQVSNDFSLLGLSEARLAAFCNAQGRMLASLIGYKRNVNDIFMICSKDILQSTLKRLSMFVMRAKLQLSDASDEFAIFGWLGSELPALANSIALEAHPLWFKADFDEATLVKLYPADGLQRAFWVAPTDDPAPAGAAVSPALWHWSEVRSGIVTVTQPLVGAFVPQMLNYESVGGVNFKKGCYPGQEVVARSQFRGTLKRRAYLAHAAQEINVGDALYDTDDINEPCGQVAQVAANPNGGFDAIVSIKISAFETKKIHTESPSGPLLTLSPPPYPLRTDI
jgi:folate-binding protein YgfZ